MSRVLLTIFSDDEWIPLSFIPASQQHKYRTYSYRTEYSKSGRAKCRKCGENIPKGVIRVGTPIKWQGGTYGFISSWSHLGCTRVKADIPDVDLATFPLIEECYGYANLPADQQAQVAAEMLSPDTPSHLEVFNPDEQTNTRVVPLPMSPPPLVRAEMMLYQREGLGWMTGQEGDGWMGMNAKLQGVEGLYPEHPTTRTSTPVTITASSSSSSSPSSSMTSTSSPQRTQLAPLTPEQSLLRTLTADGVRFAGQRYHNANALSRTALQTQLPLIEQWTEQQREDRRQRAANASSLDALAFGADSGALVIPEPLPSPTPTDTTVPLPSPSSTTSDVSAAGDIDTAPLVRVARALAAGEAVQPQVVEESCCSLLSDHSRDYEGSLTRGGILADEMGMGKTLQSIALIATQRYRWGQRWARYEQLVREYYRGAGGDAVGTLAHVVTAEARAEEVRVCAGLGWTFLESVREEGGDGAQVKGEETGGGRDAPAAAVKVEVEEGVGDVKEEAAVGASAATGLKEETGNSTKDIDDEEDVNGKKGKRGGKTAGKGTAKATGKANGKRTAEAETELSEKEKKQQAKAAKDAERERKRQEREQEKERKQEERERAKAEREAAKAAKRGKGKATESARDKKSKEAADLRDGAQGEPIVAPYLYPHPGAGPTLLVLPAAALLQWRSELEHFLTRTSNDPRPMCGLEKHQCGHGSTAARANKGMGKERCAFDFHWGKDGLRITAAGEGYAGSGVSVQPLRPSLEGTAVGTPTSGSTSSYTSASGSMACGVCSGVCACGCVANLSLLQHLIRQQLAPPTHTCDDTTHTHTHGHGYGSASNTRLPPPLASSLLTPPSLPPHVPPLPGLGYVAPLAPPVDAEHHILPLRILIFYGDRADLTAPELCQYDIVMTTYSVVEYEYRAQVNKKKVRCPYCAKRMLPRTLVSHLKYFCGPDARRTEKLMRRGKREEGDGDDEEEAEVEVEISEEEEEGGRGRGKARGAKATSRKKDSGRRSKGGRGKVARGDPGSEDEFVVSDTSDASEVDSEQWGSDSEEPEDEDVRGRGKRASSRSSSSGSTNGAARGTRNAPAKRRRVLADSDDEAEVLVQLSSDEDSAPAATTKRGGRGKGKTGKMAVSAVAKSMLTLGIGAMGRARTDAGEEASEEITAATTSSSSSSSSAGPAPTSSFGYRAPPTLTNIYREYMSKAQRKPLGMYERETFDRNGNASKGDVSGTRSVVADGIASHAGAAANVSVGDGGSPAADGAGDDSGDMHTDAIKQHPLPAPPAPPCPPSPVYDDMAGDGGDSRDDDDGAGVPRRPRGSMGRGRKRVLTYDDSEDDDDDVVEVDRASDIYVDGEVETGADPPPQTPAAPATTGNVRPRRRALTYADSDTDDVGDGAVTVEEGSDEEGEGAVKGKGKSRGKGGKAATGITGRSRGKSVSTSTTATATGTGAAVVGAESPTVKKRGGPTKSASGSDDVDGAPAVSKPRGRGKKAAAGAEGDETTPTAPVKRRGKAAAGGGDGGGAATPTKARGRGKKAAAAGGGAEEEVEADDDSKVDLNALNKYLRGGVRGGESFEAQARYMYTVAELAGEDDTVAVTATPTTSSFSSSSSSAPQDALSLQRERCAAVSLCDEEEVEVGSSALHCVHWGRIIIDEAHRIKGRVTATSKAVYALRADHKWALSGTPLQNRVGELYSLVRYLRLDPQATYRCSMQGCGCVGFSWVFGRDNRACWQCGHAPMRHYSWFNNYIANPISRYGYVGDGKRGLLLLQQGVLDLCMLRRTKRERAGELSIPPLTQQKLLVDMTAPEQDFYESIYTQSKTNFDSYVRAGTMLHNYAHIFTLLSRLRQAANHPYLVLYGKNGEARAQARAAQASVDANNTAATAAATSRTDAAGTGGGGGDGAGVSLELMHDDDIAATPVTSDASAPATVPTTSEAAAVPAPVGLPALFDPATIAASATRSRVAAGDTCVICRLDILGVGTIAACRHTFHTDCLDQHIHAFDMDPARLARRAAGVAGEDDYTPLCPSCFVPLVVASELRGLDVVVQGDARAMAVGADGAGADSGLIGPGDNNSSSTITSSSVSSSSSSSAAPAAPGACLAQCLACLTVPRQLVNLPCGHCCLCRDCHRQTTDKRCVVCRAPIAKVINVNVQSGTHTDAPAISTSTTVALHDDSASTTTPAPSLPPVLPSVRLSKSSLLSHIALDSFTTSSKLTAIVSLVSDMVRKDAQSKCLVFTQYGDMIDLVEWSLGRAGIPAARYSGELTLAQRKAVLRAFATDPKLKCLVLSLKAGGEGLNLQVADHVIIAEPWWNPAVQAQAVQRCHRIGQTRPVQAYQLIVRGSIEEKMVELQHKKQLIFEGTVDNNNSAYTQLTHEDLQFLFG